MALSKMAIILSGMIGTLFGESPRPRAPQDPALLKLQEDLKNLQDDLRNGKKLPLLTPQQFHDEIRNGLLTCYRSNLRTTQKCLKALQEKAPHDRLGIEFFQKQELYLKAQVENLEGGSLDPVMPVVPRYSEPSKTIPRVRD